MSKTLFKYIFKMQIKTLFFISLFVFCLIALFDFAEAARKFPVTNPDDFLFAMKISIERVPSTFCEILHYVYFITVTSCLWHLCNSNQITILKSAGKSPWQILFPFFCCAVFVASVWLFVLHPFGIYSEKLYKKSITRENTTEEVNADIWIDSKKNNQLIFIKKFSGNKINGLYIFNTKNGDRIFSQEALIEPNNLWKLSNVSIVENGNMRKSDTLEISSFISKNLLKILSKPPRKHDIYCLYKIPKIQRQEKVELRSYELELNKLLVYCAHFLLFVLMSAVICFPINRYNITKTDIAFKIAFFAIALRFINGIFESFASTGLLSVQLASWVVMVVLFCFFIAVLIWREV